MPILAPLRARLLSKASFVYLTDDMFDVAGRRDLGYDIAEQLRCPKHIVSVVACPEYAPVVTRNSLAPPLGAIPLS